MKFLEHRHNMSSWRLKHSSVVNVIIIFSNIFLIDRINRYFLNSMTYASNFNNITWIWWQKFVCTSTNINIILYKSFSERQQNWECRKKFLNVKNKSKEICRMELLKLWLWLKLPLRWQKPQCLLIKNIFTLLLFC